MREQREEEFGPRMPGFSPSCLESSGLEPRLGGAWGCLGSLKLWEKKGVLGDWNKGGAWESGLLDCISALGEWWDCTVTAQGRGGSPDTWVLSSSGRGAGSGWVGAWEPGHLGSMCIVVGVGDRMTPLGQGLTLPAPAASHCHASPQS